MTTLLFPGQGSQAKGMGADLFAEFPDLVAVADRVLGRSLVALVRDDPGGDLRRTQFTQPALYAVGAMSYLGWRAAAGRDPDRLIGHSLGELTALFAGGAFDFEAGLRLVAKRGALMAALGEGSMAAVIGLDETAVARVLTAGHDRLDIANINTPSQIVLGGAPADLKAAEPALLAAGARAIIPLNVSGAFHSRAMRGAQADFAAFLDTIALRDPRVPVISNVTARPHAPGAVRANLAAQLCNPVRFAESIRWLWGQGEETFIEMAPGNVLSGMVAKIRAESTPLAPDPAEPPAAPRALPIRRDVPAPTISPPAATAAPAVTAIPAGSLRKLSQQMRDAAEQRPGGLMLGAASFRRRFGVAEAFVSGGLGFGIASPALVERLARAGFLAFLGADGIPDADVARMIVEMRTRLAGVTFGVNVRGHAGDDAATEARIRLLIDLGVDCVELGGFHRVTRQLVLYRLKRVDRAPDGSPIAGHRLIAKVTRPETAEAFLSPPPPALVEELRACGEISAATAAIAADVPMADAVTALGDCGGDTDGGVLWALLPVVLGLRQRLSPQVTIGAGGGIGTPEAAAAAFVMGADYVHLGSTMQCTVEAATSDVAKDMLASMGVQDTDLAPSEDWFDWGGKVRVLKRGSLFAARAVKLHDIYRFYESWNEVPAAERTRIEQKYLRARFEDVAAAALADNPAARNAAPKQLLALVFRRHLADARRFALQGESARSADFQIWTGPALGAFNAFVAGTALQDWRQRHADTVARTLAEETRRCLERSLARFGSGPPQPGTAGRSKTAMAP